MNDIYLQVLHDLDGLKVIVVDGSEVRKDVEIDFIFGGHDLAFDCIPKGEIWIDDELSLQERDFTVLHEATERSLMLMGLSYDEAHEKADCIEQSYRKDDTDLAEEIERALKANCSCPHLDTAISLIVLK